MYASCDLHEKPDAEIFCKSELSSDQLMVVDLRSVVTRDRLESEHLTLTICNALP